MLGGIVADALRNEPDIELVGQLARGVDFEPLAARHLADVLIVGATEPHDPARAGRLLLEGSAARVVIIAMSGQDAVLYQLRPEKTLLGELSPQGLIEEHIGAEVVELYSTDPSHSDAMALLQGAADHVERAGDEVFGFFRRSESARALLPDLAEHHVVHRKATLEDVFLRLTGRELRE